ncbi:MAG: 1,4-dihydroxy-2-naphthoyl-CoA hydrolase [Marinoscillum sp.]|jgi:1,4-dihydroxy-2-naphthoyl-CoA hydrolase
MFPKNVTITGLNEFCKNTAVSHLDIDFVEIGEDYLVAEMPVSEKTKQSLGLLHGGASVLLAETLGSVAASLVLDKSQFAVGLEINANHLKSARDGKVIGKVTPIHIGKSTHLWEIRITNEAGQLITISKITMAILDHKK